MRGLAQPQDLLLHFRESLEPQLHRQVAARHHDPDRRRTQACQQHARQVLEGLAVLDLQHDPELPGPEPVQVVFQAGHVGGAAHEGQRHDVREADHRFQVGDVLVRERGERELRLREIDALLGTQPRALGAGVRDAHGDQLVVVGLDHAANPPVVEPHRLARAYLQEGGIQRAVDPRRCLGLAPGAAHRVASGLGGAGQQQRIAAMQHDRWRHRGQPSDAAREQARVLAPELDHGAALQVEAVTQIGHQRVRVLARQRQLARLAARVAHAQAVAIGRAAHDVGADADARRRAHGLRLGADELDARRALHAAEGVALRFQLQQLPQLAQGAGAQLRAGEIDLDAAAPSGLPFGRAQVARHRLPARGVVVCAVDAHDVHSGLEQLAHQPRIVRRLARHGHHDARGAGLRRGAQQGARVVREQQRPGAQVHRPRRMWRRCAAGQPRQVCQYRIDAGERAGFHVRQRRQPATDQVGLQRADIVAAHAQVVQEIARAGAMGGLDGFDGRGMRGLQLQGRGADLAQCAQQALQHARVEGVGERGCRCIGCGSAGFHRGRYRIHDHQHAPGV